MGGLEAAEKVVPRLAHVVGKVYKKNRFVFSVFRKGPSERRRDFVKMENFLYECIYDVLQNTYPHGQKIIMLNRLKAKITSLHRDKLQRVMLDNDEPIRLAGERPALFHILQMRKRQELYRMSVGTPSRQ